MPGSASTALVASGVAALLALYLLGGSPSERSDWQRVSAESVVWIRSCWVVSAMLAATALAIAFVKRHLLRVEIRIAIAALVAFAASTLAIVFTQYFLW